jgi:hypothetical protein
MSTPSESPQAADGPSARDARLWTAVLAGPIAWALSHLGVFVLTRHLTATMRRSPLFLIVALALVATLLGANYCYRRWRRSRGEPGEPHTLAGWGVALDLFFALAILANFVPIIAFGPRDLP